MKITTTELMLLAGGLTIVITIVLFLTGKIEFLNQIFLDRATTRFVNY
ncbi:hypothetical protein LFU01_40310 [Lysinibacillus fusiformis]|nr:hypothetical protein LFU01_40310 [Lysinibacillus fusiformis]